ncbi:MAG TPA: hypothetical protein VHD90_17100 [Phototrophicaceae bacterium]|nr:hypothetical protein [Phototrophicaceae bacterium]
MMNNTLFSELQSAMEAELTPKVLDILVEVARIALYQNDKDYAAEILVLALQYPMRVETLEDAEVLFSTLESELDPKVIDKACALAQLRTLEDMVAYVLATAAE